MAEKIRINICSPLKLRNSLIENHHACCCPLIYAKL